MLKDFIENNNYLLNTIMEIIGLILSAFSVYFGRKAYLVAQKIFDDGLQIKKQEVLSHVSVEFITEFINPFENFLISTKSLWENAYDAQNVFAVRDILKNNAFSVAFPYFDVHKGDIWDSLAVCGETEQGKAFNDILRFVDKAKRFGDSVNNLYKKLDECLEDTQELSAVTTLNDLFQISKNLNKDMFERGREMIKEMEEYVSRLPEKLKITETQRKLYRN